MSQVTFRTTYKGKRAEVMAGWDNPLRYYHLTIFDLDAGDDEDECIYSGMESEAFQVKTIDPLKVKLDKFGIKPPDGFWEHVEPKAGNVYIRYVDGKWEVS